MTDKEEIADLKARLAAKQEEVEAMAQRLSETQDFADGKVIELRASLARIQAARDALKESA